MPIISDEYKRTFSLRDVLRQVSFQLVHTMQLELELKSYWHREDLEEYRMATEFDSIEYKSMDVTAAVKLDEVFEPLKDCDSNKLIGGMGV